MKFLSCLCLLGCLSGLNPSSGYDRFDGRSPEEKILIPIVERLGTMPDVWIEAASQLDDEEWIYISKDEFVELIQPPDTPEIPDTYLNCNQCVAAISLASSLIKSGRSYEDIKNISMVVCRPIVSKEGWNPDTLCEPVLDTYAPHVIYILNETDKSPREICRLYNYCKGVRPRLPTHVDHASKSSVVLGSDEHKGQSKQELKDKRGKVQPTRENGFQGAFRLLHLTDLHPDQEYAANTPNVCDMPLCCRDDSNGTGSALYWGDYECNTPYRTVSLILEFIMNNLGPDFIAYTGDTLQHTIWHQPQEETIEASRRLTEALWHYFPGIRAYPSVGNHDTSPTNLYYVSRPEIQELNQAMFEHWTPLADFTEEQQETFLKGAYFSSSPYPGLRVISYNSNFLHFDNFYCVLIVDEDDFPQMQQFMEESLAAARANNEKVVLLGHHPTGGNSFVTGYDVFITDIQARYGDIIVLHLLGHSHSDSFTLVRDYDSNSVRGVQVSSPSLTSYTDINPSFRIIYIDPDTFEPLDMDTYYLDLKADGNNETPRIQLSYSFKEEYSMADLSPSSFEDLVLRLQNDPNLMSKYRYNLETRTGTEGSCDDGCVKNTICRMQNSDSARREECYNSQ